MYHPRDIVDRVEFKAGILSGNLLAGRLIILLRSPYNLDLLILLAVLDSIKSNYNIIKINLIRIDRTSPNERIFFSNGNTYKSMEE